MPDGSTRTRRRDRRHPRLQAPVPPLPDRAGVQRRVPRRSRSTSCSTTCGRRSRPARSTSRLAIPISSTARRTRAVSSNGSRGNVPGVTYDVTIKIEHLLKHAEMLPLLRDTGCLFVTSAVESIDPVVLERLRKGHTRADFVAAVALCRRRRRASVADVRSVYAVDDDGRATSSCSISWRRWASRKTSRRFSSASGCWSPLIRRCWNSTRSATAWAPSTPASLTWPWRHRDPAVDRLQAEVMQMVGVDARRVATRRLRRHRRAGARASRGLPRAAVSRPRAAGRSPPHLTEAWYCCAEPGPDIANYV